MSLGGESRRLCLQQGPKLGGCVLSLESQADWQTDLGKVDALSLEQGGSGPVASWEGTSEQL